MRKRNLHQKTSFCDNHLPLLFALLLATLLFVAPCSALAVSSLAITRDSVTNSPDELHATVYFRQGTTQLDLSYHNNEYDLEQFLQRYKKLLGDTAVRLSTITVTGATSPEGRYTLNQQHAQKRAESLATYLRRTLALADSQIVVRPIGIDWQKLAIVADTLPGLPNRQAVIQIINDVPELSYASGKQIELRKLRIAQLDNERAWRYLYDKTFHDLRTSTASLSVSYKPVNRASEPRTKAEQPAVQEKTGGGSDDDASSKAEQPSESASSEEEQQSPSCDILAPRPRHMVFALRSNLLLPLLNIGAELPLGNHWSIAADYYYPWLWRKDNHENCFQLIFLSGEARYWFGRHHSKERRLLGHSVAAYGAWGYYDFEHNWTGHQGYMQSAGVDYLYALPIAKGRLHLEFQLAFGYIHTNAQPYDVFDDGGKLIRRHDVYKNFSYFGPTKAAVSLVLPLKKKGGRR